MYERYNIYAYQFRSDLTLRVARNPNFCDGVDHDLLWRRLGTSRLVVLGRSARARATEPAPATLHAHSMGLKVLKLPKTAFFGGGLIGAHKIRYSE